MTIGSGILIGIGVFVLLLIMAVATYIATKMMKARSASTPVPPPPPPGGSGTATAPAPAPTTPPPPPSGSSKKLWWVLGGLALLALSGSMLMGWLPSVSSSDFAATTPGQAIEKEFGRGWAPWVMGAILFFIAVGLINFFREGGKSKIFGSLGTLALVALVVILVAGVHKMLTKEDQAKADQVITIDLSRANDGEEVMGEMLVTQTLIIKTRTSNRDKDDGDHWPCVKVISKTLNFEPMFRVVAGAYTTHNHIKMVPEDRVRLVEGHTPSVTYLVRQTYHVGPDTPCLYHVK